MPNSQPTYNSIREDARAKVTGQARYSEDYNFPGLLHACVLWAPVPKAKLEAIDTSAAEQQPGLVKIITRTDICGPNIGGQVGAIYFDHPVLVGPGEQINNICEAVALVVAESQEQALRARDAISLRYVELPALHTAAEAIAAGEEPACRFSEQRGDVEAAFAQAKLVVEQDYFFPFQDHIYLETECGCAYLDAKGIINIIAATQDQKQQHCITCNALGLPYNKVRLRLPQIGGGFGGKHSMAVHAHLALIVHLTGRPVRLVWSREESIRFSCKKQQVHVKHALAFDEAGLISGMCCRIVGECSPYLEKTMGRLQNLRKAIYGVYRYPAFDMQAEMYKTTSPEIGAFRGVALPDGTFVIETLIDQAATALGLDPFDLRRRNWARNEDELRGQYSGSAIKINSAQWLLEKTVNTALAKAGPPPVSQGGKRCGRGMACSGAFYFVSQSDTQRGAVAKLRLHLDGSIIIDLCYPELGQGLTTVMRDIVSRVLDAPPQRVKVLLHDSGHTNFGCPLGGSQATCGGGLPLWQAAVELKERLISTARSCLGWDKAAPLFYRAEGFYAADGKLLLPWNDFSAYCNVKCVCLETSVETLPPIEGLYSRTPATPVCCVADVEVDPETGHVEVLQLITAHDIGRVLNYDAALGQVIGSTVMCLGELFMEEFRMKNGYPETSSMAEYLVPTALDLPQRNIVEFIEGNLDPYTVEGAKGLGEHGMYNTAAAIANAISRAIGRPLTELPLSEEKILRALGKL